MENRYFQVFPIGPIGKSSNWRDLNEPWPVIHHPTVLPFPSGRHGRSIRLFDPLPLLTLAHLEVPVRLQRANVWESTNLQVWNVSTPPGKKIVNLLPDDHFFWSQVGLKNEHSLKPPIRPQSLQTWCPNGPQHPMPEGACCLTIQDVIRLTQEKKHGTRLNLNDSMYTVWLCDYVYIYIHIYTYTYACIHIYI